MPENRLSWSARIYVNRENISVHFIPYGPSHQFWRKMWFREYKVWCVSVRKRTHIHCIFTVSFPRKWWKYKKIVILSKTFQLNNLSRRMIMKITIWSTYNNFFCIFITCGEYTVNMCTLSYRDTPDFVLSEPHFPHDSILVWSSLYLRKFSLVLDQCLKV